MRLIFGCAASLVLAGLLGVMAVLHSKVAAANDSSAELAAGGLVLVRTDKVAMQREDLSLSPDVVRRCG